MIWAILALLGVPLWLCGIGFLILVVHYRSLSKRPEDVPVRVHRSGKKRWARGHGVWVANVFAWRASPAAWNETSVEVTSITVQTPSDEQRKSLHRLGDDFVVATVDLARGEAFDVATTADHRDLLLGPFAEVAVR